MYNNKSYFNRNHKNFDRNNVIASVKFRNNEKDIELQNPKSILTPHNCYEYDKNLVFAKDLWHQILVFKDQDIPITKHEIESALTQAVNNNFFVPIAYRNGVNEDVFYIIDQGHALEELINKSLLIEIDDKKSLSLTVKLGIAQYKPGHIEPLKKISEALELRLKKMQGFKLDLSNFKASDEFFDIKILLESEKNLEAVFDVLTRVMSSDYFQAAKHKIAHIDLSSNGIKSLKPLGKLNFFKNIEGINFKDNKIVNVLEIENLRNFKIKHLTLLDNPVASDSEKLYTILASTLPNLIHCDIPRVLLQSSLESASKKRRLTTHNENIPKNEGGNIVTSDDINAEFKENFEKQQMIKTSWSKVFVEHNGKVDSKKILDEMFEQFFMYTICYPCYYRAGSRDDSFYLYRNFDAINILVKNNLKMNVDEKVITFRLHLRCADHQAGQVKFYEDIPKAIKSRHNGLKLDLKNFQKDPLLKNLIVNMSTVKGFIFITDWMSKIKDLNQIVEIDLSNNEIKSLSALELLKMFPNLKVLNLSNNQIVSMDEFPQDLNIVVLSLDHNPICTKYFEAPYRYVSMLKQLCLNLEYIDGKKIISDLKIVTLKNFHCTSVAFNAVENFVDYFFRNYDGDRNILKGIYTKNSIYTERYGKSVKTILGASNIMSHIFRIPPTSHDLINTTIDVPLFNGQNIQMVINGILELNQKLYTYTRTLLMMTRGERAIGTLSNTFYFYITNEIFQFDDIHDSIIRNRAFKSEPASLVDIQKAYEGMFNEDEEMQAKISLLQQITKLKIKWCERFLRKSNGNINDALKYFINFYNDRILKLEDFEVPRG